LLLACKPTISRCQCCASEWGGSSSMVMSKRTRYTRTKKYINSPIKKLNRGV
jgi:hypothetical protein